MTSIAPHLDIETLDALTGEASRPRALTAGQGALMMLRDVPADIADDADDLPSIRLYIDTRMVVTLCRRPVRSLSKMRDLCAREALPAGTTGAFLHDLMMAIADNVLDLIEVMADRTDRLEDAVDAPGPSDDPRSTRSDLAPSLRALDAPLSGPAERRSRRIAQA